MNLPATQSPNRLPLRPQPTDDLRPILRKLFNSYELPWVGKEPRTAEEHRLREAMNADRAESYSDALRHKGIPAWAADKARLDFISASVDRRNRHKLPSAEEFCDVAKAHVDAESARQAAARLAQQQLQERKRTEQFLANRPPAEERARKVKEILARAGRNME